MANNDLKSNREKLWNFMFNCRYELNCARLYHQHIHYINILFKVFFAVISSGAVTSWLIWDKYQQVWADLVAISLLLSVIYEVLPFIKSEKDAESLCKTLTDLYTCVEDTWSESLLEEDYEVGKRYTDMLNRWELALNNGHSGAYATVSKKTAKKASDDALKYFNERF